MRSKRKKAKTRADYIRMMDDDELTELLQKISSGAIVLPHNIKAYLQREVKHGKNDI